MIARQHRTRLLWTVACTLFLTGAALAGTGGSTVLAGVPEPAALALLGVGVVGILAIRSLRRKD